MAGADFLLRETDIEYREQAKEHLTSHALADFCKCPLLYQRKRQGLVPDEDRPAYVLGRAAHKLILEGAEAFVAGYAVGGPINEKTGKPYGPQTKAYAEWAATQDKAVITEGQYALIVNLAASVDSHPVAVELLADGVAEGVARAEYCGLPAQSRLDFYSPVRGLIDLKTCDDLCWFEADARRYGYSHQMAFYQAMLGRLLGNLVEVPVHIIAVEKKEPYRCGVWVMDQKVLAHARRENEAAIERLKACENSGAWPTGYEERRVFDYV